MARERVSERETKPMRKLEALRRAKGYTQRELAYMCGLDGTAVSNFENGKRIPNMKTAAKLAKALGCSVSDLNDYED